MNKKTIEILKNLEKTKEKYWCVSKEVGAFLNQLIKNSKFKKIFEIGTSIGYSGIWLADALTSNKGTLYTIESHKERFELARENFKKSGLKNIKQIFGHAPEKIPATLKNLDMVFLDATKYEHISYFEKIENKIKKGGLIITDNINSHHKDLAPFISYLQAQKNWSTIILDIDKGISISQKTC